FLLFNESIHILLTFIIYTENASKPITTVEGFLESIKMTEHLPELRDRHKINTWSKLMALTEKELFKMDIPTTDCRRILKRLNKIRDASEPPNPSTEVNEKEKENENKEEKKETDDNPVDDDPPTQETDQH